LDLSVSDRIEITRNFSKHELLKIGISVQFRITLIHRCGGITDRGISALADRFKELTSLKGIQLIFVRCIKITHGGFLSLTEGLETLQGLEWVDFNFCECGILKKNIDSETLNELINRLYCARLNFS